MNSGQSFAQVKHILDQLQPMIIGHGGQIELVNVENNQVYVRLHGACVGCPSSFFTLKFGIEEAIKQQIPDILGVVVIE